MRIALVSQEYPPETAKGGIGTQTYIKAHGLASLGHDVHVISRSPTAQRTECESDGVVVTRIPGFESRVPVYTDAADWLSYSAEVAAGVASVHSKTPLDIVDFPEWGGEGYVHLLNRTEWNHLPTVVHLHGPMVMLANTLGWPSKDSELFRAGTTMEGTCVRLADAVFSSSRCSAEWCARFYERELDEIPIIHTGVDTKLFSPREIPKASRPTIVFAGKLARNKGVALLLDACCRLAPEFPNLHLRLLGRGDPQVVAELEARAFEAGYPDLLDVAGFTDRAELPRQFSLAHIFAAPSTYEGGPGFVYLEAMACGLPVIACEGSGVTELVRHGVTGLLVPPEDSNVLTLAIRSLLADPNKAREMGKRGRKAVVAEADSAACLKNLESFYVAVVEGRK